jgi:hypothetical protein
MALSMQVLLAAALSVSQFPREILVIWPSAQYGVTTHLYGFIAIYKVYAL